MLIAQSVEPYCAEMSSEKLAQELVQEPIQLVDIASINSFIKLDIRYATVNNFIGRAVYPAAKCLLRKEAAAQLIYVQKLLQQNNKRLIVFDCYRPFSIQQTFWRLVPDARYVAKPILSEGLPIAGSRHNRGMAVDVSLADEKGLPLEMPTDFDDFSEKAHRNYKGHSQQAKKHLQILEQAMHEAGFKGIATEWWHFDAIGWEKYTLLDISF